MSAVGIIRKFFGGGGRRSAGQRPTKSKGLTTLFCESLEHRWCPAGFYDLQVIAQTNPGSDDGFRSLGIGPSINDAGVVAFVGSKLNNGDGNGNNREVGDNLYAYDPTTQSTKELMNRAFMYPNANAHGNQAGSQVFGDRGEVQINNSGEVVARRRLNARVSVGPIPFGTVLTQSLSYVETWNSGIENGLPSRQVAMGDGGAGVAGPLLTFLNPITAGLLPSPFAIGSDFSGLLRYASINNQGESAFGAIASTALGSGYDLVASSGGGYTKFDISPQFPVPMIADNGTVVFRNGADNQPILAVAKGFKSSQEIAGPSTGFTQVGLPGISDDGRVISFVGVSATGQSSLYASTYDVNLNAYSRPTSILGVSGNGVLDYGEYYNESGLDTGGITQFRTDTRTSLSLTSGADYTVAFLATNSTRGKELYSISIHVAQDLSISGDAPLRVLGVGDHLQPNLSAISDVAIHDTINNRGQLAFHVSSAQSEAIVLATPCGGHSTREVNACSAIDIRAIDLIGSDARTIVFRYEVESDLIHGPFNVQLFRSSTPTFDLPTSIPISSILSVPLFDSNQNLSYSSGEHVVQLTLPNEIFYDPAAPYVFVFADAPRISSDFNGDYNERQESNNSVLFPMADLTSVAFHYLVPTDSTKTANGPLPTNSTYEVTVTVRNDGRYQSLPAVGGIFLSRDSLIDIGVDFRIGTVAIPAITPGGIVTVGIQMSPPTLWPQASSPWFGSVTVGLVIDPDGLISDYNRINNLNIGSGIDSRPIQLYDGIPQVSTAVNNATYRQALLWLVRNGFHPVPPLTGSGWSTHLSGAVSIFSAFDGISRSGYAYRKNAFLLTNGMTYSILLQGSNLLAEPSPETAAFYGHRWFSYVADWHPRF